MGEESLSVRKGAVGVKCSTRIHRGDEWAPDVSRGTQVRLAAELCYWVTSLRNRNEEEE